MHLIMLNFLTVYGTISNIFIQNPVEGMAIDHSSNEWLDFDLHCYIMIAFLQLLPNAMVVHIFDQLTADRKKQLP